MPQPLKPRDGQIVHRNPKVLEQRPDCAVQIAMVASAWSTLEDALIYMFANVTGETKQIAADTWSIIGNRIAFRALHAIENLHLRITVVKAATAEILTPTLRQAFDELATEVRRRAGDRNEIVHGTWAICDAYPNDVLLRQDIGPPETWTRYTEGDLRDVVLRILRVAGSVTDFSHRHVMQPRS